MTVKIVKAVLQDHKEPYLKSGWKEEFGTMLAKDLPYEPVNAKSKELMILQSIPVLVQRGTINRPLTKYQDKMLTSAVTLHYMGNSMFDGAITNSLLCIQAQFFGYRVVTVPEITKSVKGKSCALRIYGCFDSKEDEDQYIDWIKRMHNKELTLSEWSAFEQDCKIADFWWDLTNHVIFSFDRNFLERLPSNIQASINKL